jgi:hypothetical protein
MPLDSRTETVSTYQYACDRCGKEVQISQVLAEGEANRKLGAPDPLPPGWAVMKFGGQTIFFHTQKCAISYFRARVDESFHLDRDSDAPKRKRRTKAEAVPA